MRLPAAVQISCSRRHSRLPLALVVAVLAAPTPPKPASPMHAQPAEGRRLTEVKHAEHTAVLRLVQTAQATDIAVQSGSWTKPHTWRGGARGRPPTRSTIAPRTVRPNRRSAGCLFVKEIDQLVAERDGFVRMRFPINDVAGNRTDVALALRVTEKAIRRGANSIYYRQGAYAPSAVPERVAMALR